eukprot:TRINITY_DN84563_c0_g1_i1.p1 TRINITY_DN84563_c0_g1~~TRINITY_DN84563_c0_g1_i1.p1  ORF type:complete len:216 (-),score=41.14 TRINITY_DN84563_c0_g1_i1:343-990(-)
MQAFLFLRDAVALAHSRRIARRCGLVLDWFAPESCDMARSSVTKVVSGGQTGVDQAALSCALAAGISIGGWCPHGEVDENGPLPAALAPHLEEVTDEIWSDFAVAGDFQSVSSSLAFDPTDIFARRTLMNTWMSDATLVVIRGAVQDGTNLAMQAAQAFQKELLVVGPDAPPDEVLQWLSTRRPAVLNIAGPRESQSPGIHEASCVFFQKLFKDV